MSVHGLTHPKSRKRRARYGFDRALGFFATVFDGERVVAEYDRTRPRYDDLNGALRFLVEHGFLAPHDIDGAISLGRTHELDEMPPDVARAAKVIEDLRRGSDDG